MSEGPRIQLATDKQEQQDCRGLEFSWAAMGASEAALQNVGVWPRSGAFPRAPIHARTGAPRDSGFLLVLILHTSLVSASFLCLLQIEGCRVSCSQPLKTHREVTSAHDSTPLQELPTPEHSTGNAVGIDTTAKWRDRGGR